MQLFISNIMKYFTIDILKFLKALKRDIFYTIKLFSTI